MDSMKEAGKAVTQWVKDFVDRAAREPTATEAWFAALKWQAARQSAGANESTLRVLSSHAIRKHEGVTIFGDPAQVLKVMAAIESAGATGRMNGALQQLADKQRPLDPECAKVLHENLGDLYSDMQPAVIGDNGAKSSGSVAFDYGNRLVNAKLDPSYAQPSNEPIPQHLEGQSYDAWDAFQKHPESQMSNSDDFWPIWRDAWDAAREQPAESKRAALTEEQWRSIQAPTGSLLFDAGVHSACTRIRELLARASAKGER